MGYFLRTYRHCNELPPDWNEVVGQHNLLLSKEYFCVLEESQPENMNCVYVGFFENETLIGGALFQYLDFHQHQVLQQNKVSCSIRNYLTKHFSKDVLILGNNMLTGQNGFYFNHEKIGWEKVTILLKEASEKIQDEIKKPSLVIFKDYQASVFQHFKESDFKSYYRFSVQPNMVFELRENWRTYDDYLNDFSKKYRTRAKTARKKLNISGEVMKRELNLEEVIFHQKSINMLYHHVAENASINTFFLTENHFESLKKNLGENFRIFGYFLEGELIGFYTLILNGDTIDTYFLGYNKELQRERKIYLNMLLDMVEFGIQYQFKKIVFGRTALEIKSTIGAEPVEIFGLIKHNNKFINPWMSKIFPAIEPKIEWIPRKPFKK